MTILSAALLLFLILDPLGNIPVFLSVLKPLPPCSTAVGNPAKIVGKSLCPSAAKGMDVALKYVVTSDGRSYDSTWGYEALMI